MQWPFHVSVPARDLPSTDPELKRKTMQRALLLVKKKAKRALLYAVFPSISRLAFPHMIIFVHIACLESLVSTTTELTSFYDSAYHW